MPQSVPWVASRKAGLDRLAAFLPHAGSDYARERNFDRGETDRGNVSTLSPYLRHRLITEQEVVAAISQRHGLRRAEKFIQEVLWRTYWKGWLELRPALWFAYKEARDRSRASLLNDSAQHDLYLRATQGHTGLECLDAWSRELVATGYLHNHARMWFASIWVFTLRLPWELGADFFLRHLLDGDPASNTLSWRWVCGLQTRGKTYLARPDNIEQFTEGRFRMDASLLAGHAPSLEGEPFPAIKRLTPAADPRSLSGQEIGLLLTEEDLAPESWPLEAVRVRAIAGCLATNGRSPEAVSEPVRRFVLDALEDGVSRAAALHHAPVEPERIDCLDWSAPVTRWADQHTLRHIVTAEAPVGPVRSALDRLEPALNERGIRLHRLRRPWDAELWPLATGGFFTFKERMWPALERLLPPPRLPLFPNEQ